MTKLEAFTCTRKYVSAKLLSQDLNTEPITVKKNLKVQVVQQCDHLVFINIVWSQRTFK